MAKTETPAEAPRAKGKIVTDPELLAMNRINRIILSLPENARERVSKWLWDKVNPPLFQGDRNGQG